MATVQMGEYVQTMGRQAATVVVAELIANVIGAVIWWATVAVGQPEIVKRTYFQGAS